ncbi:STAS domain-containing protein [Streptomyces sp. NPDC000961]|uniref:STAS domain-containing protein n=1 Tax=Streptomyces sp. NPDC000961 TaxID=3364541 RepID=UPI00367C0C58
MVGLRGDLTADTVDDTRRVLLAALREAPEVLEIDVSRVTHLDPDGALALLLTARAAGDQGTGVSVTHARAQVTAVMRRTGLERYLAHGRSAR